MRFLLDTSAIAEIARNPGSRFEATFWNLFPQCFTSSVVVAKLSFGFKNKPAFKARSRVEEIMKLLDVEPFTRDMGEAYANLRMQSERGGLNIGAMDLCIAGHANTVGATLVATDKDFKRLTGLALQDWSES